MDWKTMLSYISGCVDEELLLRNEYLVAENRVLRNQLQSRLRLTDGERRSLAEFGKPSGQNIRTSSGSEVYMFPGSTPTSKVGKPHEYFDLTRSTR